MSKGAGNFQLNYFSRPTLPKLTDLERKNASILIVEPDPAIKNSLRQVISALGFAGISDAADALTALQKFEQRKFTHIIFDAKKTNMSGREFLIKVLDFDENIIAIPSSYEPSVDDLFDLLIVGAKGYLVKPFTESSVDESIVMATKGEPISDAILYARDRNEALVSLIMTAIDKLATIMRQASQFETAKRELPKAHLAFKRALEIGKTFAKGGENQLLEAIVEFCIDRSNGPASKLGRARKRLAIRKSREIGRVDDDEDGEQEPSEAAVPEPKL